MATNVQVLLQSRPSGWPTKDNFSIVEGAIPTPSEGEVLIRGHYLSLDPYMRGRMNAGASYVKPVDVGAVMCGEVVGEVLVSNNSKFASGDFVQGDLGWQEYAISNGKTLRKLDPRVPLSANLSVVGMPGATAYIGLIGIGQPKAGETVVVSAASGAVGSIVGQIAKIKECRAVGIAGGPDKCRMVLEEFGFDACVDYKAANFRETLAAATSKGVEVYFDNVGGEILDAVLSRMNPFSRLPLCGLISQYNATEAYGVRNFRSILVNRIHVQGFIVFDDPQRLQQAYVAMGEWFAAGKFKYRETIAHGLESAPAAFLGMLRGANVGKQLVKLVA